MSRKRKTDDNKKTDKVDESLYCPEFEKALFEYLEAYTECIENFVSIVKDLETKLSKK